MIMKIVVQRDFCLENIKIRYFEVTIINNSFHLCTTSIETETPLHQDWTHKLASLSFIAQMAMFRTAHRAEVVPTRFLLYNEPG